MKWPRLDQSMQQVSLLMEVAGLEEEWVEVNRHTAEVLLSTRATLGKFFSSEESQRLHGSSVSFLLVDVSSVTQCFVSNVVVFLCFRLPEHCTFV